MWIFEWIFGWFGKEQQADTGFDCLGIMSHHDHLSTAIAFDVEHIMPSMDISVETSKWL